MKLLVAEKPSVARVYKDLLEKVEGERFSGKDGYYEGQKYSITWCIGHLVSLADPEAYGWGEWKMEHLPMIPKTWKYDVIKDTQKQFRVVETLMNQAEALINGADAGREGELIFGLSVIHARAGNKPQERLWLNSMVFDDMVKAWKARTPSQAFMPLLESALCRAKADWLLGMNASRGYSLGTGVNGLSVGRVQTPTLALIVRRDLEIDNWKDRHFYNLSANWKNIRFLYYRDNEKNYDTETDLQPVLKQCEGQEAVVVAFSKDERAHYSGKPFDLAELQKAANKQFGFKAASTLEITQSLYEKKYVTYPRTDSQYLPESMFEDAWNILNKVAGAGEREVLRGKGDKYAFFDSSKVSDHFAIIPTGLLDGLDGLEEQEKKVFGLIRSRFVLAFAKPYTFNEYKITLDCKGHEFRARVTQELVKGFKSLFKAEEKDEESDEDSRNKITTDLNLKVGDKDILRDMSLDKKKATKPVHYTEASLLTAMETAGKTITDESLRDAMKERGLGTPATKASIIETLKRREYVEAKGKHIISTYKGRHLVALVDEKITSPEMTGLWEFKLNQMSKKLYSRQQFMTEIEDYVKSLTGSYNTQLAKDFESNIHADDEVCPKCKTARVRETPKGVFCTDSVKCGFRIWGEVCDKKLTKKNIADLLKRGKTGLIKDFKAKSGKPFDAFLKLENGEVRFEFETK